MVIERTFCGRSLLVFRGSLSALTLWATKSSRNGTEWGGVYIYVCVYCFVISKIMLIMSSTCLLSWVLIAAFQAGALRHPLSPGWGGDGRPSGPAQNHPIHVCVSCGARFHIIPKVTLGNWPTLVSTISWLQRSMGVFVPKRAEVHGRWKSSPPP